MLKSGIIMFMRFHCTYLRFVPLEISHLLLLALLLGLCVEDTDKVRVDHVHLLYPCHFLVRSLYCKTRILLNLLYIWTDK